MTDRMGCTPILPGKVTGSVKARSHCAFFLIETAISLIATNGLYRTQWKCSHYATVTTSPAPIQPIISKNKSQLQIVQCERTLRDFPV